jgi:hypothetical protein
MVELIQHWNGWGPGHRFPLMPDPVAKILIDRKIAKYVDSEDTTQRSSNATEQRNR